MALRYGRIPGSVRPGVPFAEQTLAAALGWGAGERINTRGVRGLDERGRAKGGNTLQRGPGRLVPHGEGPDLVPENGYRLIEAGQLVGFLPSNPWQGSRTSAIQRIGDVVCPPVGAVVMGALTGRAWQGPVDDYLGQVYGGGRGPGASRGAAAAPPVRTGGLGDAGCIVQRALVRVSGTRWSIEEFPGRQRPGRLGRLPGPALDLVAPAHPPGHARPGLPRNRYGQREARPKRRPEPRHVHPLISQRERPGATASLRSPSARARSAFLADQSCRELRLWVEAMVSVVSGPGNAPGPRRYWPSSGFDAGG